MIKISISVLVAIHLIATLWHGGAHTDLSIYLPPLKNLYVYIVILAAPIVGAILAWTRFARLGSLVFALAMLGALLFGVYHHYILISPDNIAHLPAGSAEAHSQFISSAALIALIELSSALFGFFAVGHQHAKSGHA